MILHIFHLEDGETREEVPMDIMNPQPVLLPLITREIIYRLLLGEQGARLRHLALQGSYTPHIARAVGHLRRNFDHPLRIENIARELGMSVSRLRYHFKAVTALSPSLFQKQLRPDRVYLGWYQDILVVLHLEMET